MGHPVPAAAGRGELRHARTPAGPATPLLKGRAVQYEGPACKPASLTLSVSICAMMSSGATLSPVVVWWVGTQGGEGARVGARGAVGLRGQQGYCRPAASAYKVQSGSRHIPLCDSRRGAGAAAARRRQRPSLSGAPPRTGLLEHRRDGAFADRVTHGRHGDLDGVRKPRARLQRAPQQRRRRRAGRGLPQRGAR